MSASTALSADAPERGGTLTVQGQDGANISGLYPSTRYSVTVTAVLNGEETASKSREAILTISPVSLSPFAEER